MPTMGKENRGRKIVSDKKHKRHIRRRKPLRKKSKQVTSS